MCLNYSMSMFYGWWLMVNILRRCSEKCRVIYWCLFVNIILELSLLIVNDNILVVVIRMRKLIIFRFGLFNYFNVNF